MQATHIQFDDVKDSLAFLCTILSIGEVADIIGVQSTTIFEWSKGILPVSRLWADSIMTAAEHYAQELGTEINQRAKHITIEA